MKNFFFILLTSYLFSQEAIINNIDLIGLISTTSEEIFRHSGLHPSEKFDDSNGNNQYDEGEHYFDWGVDQTPDSLEVLLDDHTLTYYAPQTITYNIIEDNYVIYFRWNTNED